MRTLTALVLVVATLVSATSRADGATPAPDFTARLHLLDDLHKDVDQSRAIRNAGIGLVVAGLVLTIAGAAMTATSICFADDGCPNTETQANAGIGLFVVGQIAALSGITMWAVGGTRMKKYERNISIAPTGLKIAF